MAWDGRVEGAIGNHVTRVRSPGRSRSFGYLTTAEFQSSPLLVSFEVHSHSVTVRSSLSQLSVVYVSMHGSF
jgi:hypothetical protein